MLTQVQSLVKLHGSCKSCSLSSATLQDGVESMIKHYIPEIKQSSTSFIWARWATAIQLNSFEEKKQKVDA